MRNRWQYGPALVAMALVVVGCSPPDGRSEPKLIEAWTVASITPLGQPVAAGHTVVVYGTVNQDLYLYGVAVSDGTVRWRQPATPSLLLGGIPLSPRVLDGLVAYLRPDPRAHLAARLALPRRRRVSTGSCPNPCWSDHNRHTALTARTSAS